MSVQNFFSNQNPGIVIIIYTMLFLICWNLENIYGVTRKYKKWKHSSTNFWFIISGGLLQGMIGYIFVNMLLYENDLKYGLSTYSPMVQGLVVFIVLDFTYYIYHVVMHHYKKMWRFHAVHHSDTILNVSTSLREHPIETSVRLGQYMFFALLLGPEFWIIALHQFIQVVSKIIIHSNFRLPDKLDKYLSYIIITPNMHHVHHHFERPFTDSNFGDLFSIWDRIFRTFKYLPKENVKFGLDDVNNSQACKIKNLLTTNIFIESK